MGKMESGELMLSFFSTLPKAIYTLKVGLTAGRKDRTGVLALLPAEHCLHWQWEAETLNLRAKVQSKIYLGK
jgi:hypothetical protein